MELRGIDVSSHNGAISWAKAAASGVRFAMLRAMVGKTRDTTFAANATYAAKNGIAVGAYLYSYARSVEAAASEARALIAMLEPYREWITFPVAFDIEQDSQTALGRETLTAMANAFCKTVGDAGYRTLVYANPNWLKRYYDAAALRSPVWLAHVELRPWGSSWRGEYVMHQYSWVGRVPGIKTDVDMDVSRIDFREESCMRYKTVDECPGWAQETVARLVARGIIRGRGDARGLDLTEDMLRMLVWNDRAGVYDG